MEQKSKLGNIVDYATTYVEKKAELSLLNVIEKSSKVGATIVSALILWILGSLVVIFGSIGLAWWIATLTQSVAIGFFTLTGFYFLLFLFVLLVGKKMLQVSFINFIIKHVLS